MLDRQRTIFGELEQVTDQAQDDAIAAGTLARTHEEALALAERARAWIADRRRHARNDVSIAAQAAYAAETMRMTTRIMHVLAWTLTRKAVAAGEITEREAHEPGFGLDDEPLCRRGAVDTSTLLPLALREMIAASEDLYERALRLDALLTCSAGGQDEPPVHALWRRIEGESSPHDAEE